MTYFGCVAAVRIQSWISRTPELRYVRGASLLLTQETRRAALDGLDLGDASLDPHVPEVPGVVVVRSDERAEVDAAIDTLIGHLHTKMPGLELSAWRARATSYVQAQSLRRSDPVPDGLELREWPHRLPLTLDLPFGVACARCPHEVAVRSVRQPGQQGRLEPIGPDCAQRRQVDFQSAFTNFDDLAKVGRFQFTAGRRWSHNHLATVCADGNRVGSFFDAVAQLTSTKLQTALSAALSAACTTAADEAAGCGPEGHEQVAINHFVGGDDIFASVAAPFAWRYVERLATTFEREFTARVDDALDTARREGLPDKELDAVAATAHAVSLGIGLAFANSSHPLADTRDSAQAAEATAKAIVRGNRSAVSWLDLTVEPPASVGPGSPSDGRGITTADITEELGTPPAIVTMPSSARQMVVSLLRRGPGDDGATVAARVRQWARRVDRDADIDRYLPDPAAVDPDTPLTRLALVLDRARWWPTDPDDTDIRDHEEP